MGPGCVSSIGSSFGILAAMSRVRPGYASSIGSSFGILAAMSANLTIKVRKPKTACRDLPESLTNLSF